MDTSTRSLHLYLASTPGDMDGERALIEGLVLPELRARLQGEGIEIIAVDPANATGEKWDLALRFQEIEGCQIFIGLLGERYGGALTRVPLSLVLEQPWIAEDTGRSVLELEILHGALREPGRTASFFYFRNPRFPSMVPEALRGRFLPESDEAVTRLENLKERIRSSGRPVFDGYPCGWSEGLGRAARLDTFAEQVFGDLWSAIHELARPTAEVALTASVASPPEHPSAPPSDPSFDPNATILSFPTAPSRQPERTPRNQLDKTRVSIAAPPPFSPAPPPLSSAAAASQPMAPPPMLATVSPPSASGRGVRLGFSIAAMIVLAVIGIGLFVLSRQKATRPTSIPVSLAIRSHADPPAFPTITPETWERLATACRLGSDTARTMPTRVPAGSPMVQVFASTDWIDAGPILSRYSRRHGFLLPLEENGRAVCTVMLGPFPSQQAASRAAAELRMSEGTDAKVVPFPGFTK
jgi:uncharacterized protein DUF4062